MKIPWSELQEELSADNYTGFCLACGALHDGIEPDAHGYECDECGKPRVMGCEEILLRGEIDYNR
jgi:hypothetical protein